MTTPSYTQVAFRYRNDNGDETSTGATWITTQNNNPSSLEVDKNYRMRFLIDETNNKNWANVVWTVWCSKNSGSYAQIGSGQPVNYSLSNYFAQNDNTTSQLTGGSGSFLTSNLGMQESGSSTNTGSSNDYFEIELCFQIDSTQVANGDTLDLRIYADGSPITTYSNTPRITVSEVVAYTVSKSESVGVTESKNVQISDKDISKSENVNVTTTPVVAVVITASVTESTITITDTPTVSTPFTPPTEVNKSETVNVTDVPLVSIGDITVSILESTINVTDTPLLVFDDMVIETSDTANVTDTPNVALEGIAEPDINLAFDAADVLGYGWVQGVKITGG